MPKSDSEAPSELTYALGATSHLTGVSPELLRAWERRYGVVRPLRTPGGTRRYRAADIERLRLVKAAVDAGHRIGQVAQLDLDALRTRVGEDANLPRGRLDEIFAALDRLDGAEVQRLLALQLSALGPVRFAREFAVPLVQEIGERWSEQRLGIASEHLASAILRSMLGSALQPSAHALLGPRIVFSTPSGERHELGLQMAALTALGAGASPIYLGPELPADELLDAVRRARAAALALSLVTVPSTQGARVLRALRQGLPADVGLWIGGAAAPDVERPEGVELIPRLEDLEARVARLGFETRPR